MRLIKFVNVGRAMWGNRRPSGGFRVVTPCQPLSPCEPLRRAPRRSVSESGRS